MSESAAEDGHDFKLVGLVPWMLRDEPVAIVRTDALEPIYEAAKTNLFRSDGMITSIVAAAYQTLVVSDGAPTAPTNEQFHHLGLQAWQRAATTFSLPILAQGIEGVLAAFVIQAWTTFEVLAADTWVAAVNLHPAILAELRGYKATSGESDKKIDLWQLQRNGYDLSRVMGDVLRSKFQFDSLGGIQAAYRAAFAIDADPILKPLEHESARALSAIRNVLVHRAGRADEEYLSRTKNLSLTPKAALGQPVMLDGNIVATLLLEGRERAVEMFLAVDDWLVTH